MISLLKKERERESALSFLKTTPYGMRNGEFNLINMVGINDLK